MSSVGEAAALLSQAIQENQQSASTARVAAAAVEQATMFLVDAFEDSARPEAQKALAGLRVAAPLLDDVLSLISRADESLQRYVDSVLCVPIGGAGPAAGSGRPVAADAGNSRLTRPSHPPDTKAGPRGRPARIEKNDDPDTARGRTRENEAALLLARLGYEVEQSPVVPGAKNPDYRIEGQIFDAYAPGRARVRNIARVVQDKVARKQASRIVLILDDSPVSIEELRSQFRNWPIEGLDEILVVRSGEVSRLYPDTL